MHNRMPSRRRQAPAPPRTGRQGNTVAVQGKTQTQERVPRTPHERAESADSQRAGDSTAPGMAQATREDVERGLVDTDQGPVLDQAYERVREDADDPVRKFGP